MNPQKLGEQALDELITIAVNRNLIDEAVNLDGRYRIEIGAASFTLDAEGTREFLLRLIRKHSMDVE